MFKKAIVRPPGKSLVRGLTSADLGLPDYHQALEQHTRYIQVLQECGLEVRVLAPDEAFPDSTFVEDVAVLTPRCAVITRPGAESRRGEVEGIRPILPEYFSVIEEITAPGTLEGGDVLRVGDHYYIGLSVRTNREGAEQLIRILDQYGLSGSMVLVREMLHLKSGVAWLEHNNLVACGEFLRHPEFKKFNLIEIPLREAYAANCVWINGRVLLAKGYPAARKRIMDAGYEVIELEMSEFRKLDGGLSCLSLRF
ncbi:MAG: dimethylarginine dimethylaminohydrolase [Calditrichia bacterium]